MRKLSALFILVFLFLPLAFAVMALTSIRPWVLDRGFYERIAGDERLYDVVLREDVSTRFDEELFTPVEQLPAQALSAALGEVVTPDYLRTQSLNVVNQVFDYIDGRDAKFEFALDVAPIKAALAGAGRTRFAATLAAALPDCESGQQSIAPGGSLTRCIAADSSVDATAQQIAAALPDLLADTPDQLVIESQSYLRLNWYDYSSLLGSGIHAVLDLAIVMTIITAVAAGLLGAYLGGDGQRERLKWLSAFLFTPASLFSLTGLILTSSYMVDAIGNSITTGGYSDAYRGAITSVMVPAIQQVGSGILLTGGVACLIALGLLIWSWASPASGRQTTQIVQVPIRNP